MRDLGRVLRRRRRRHVGGVDREVFGRGVDGLGPPPRLRRSGMIRDVASSTQRFDAGLDEGVAFRLLLGRLGRRVRAVRGDAGEAAPLAFFLLSLLLRVALARELVLAGAAFLLFRRHRCGLATRRFALSICLRSDALRGALLRACNRSRNRCGAVCCRRGLAACFDPAAKIGARGAAATCEAAIKRCLQYVRACNALLAAPVTQQAAMET